MQTKKKKTNISDSAIKDLIEHWLVNSGYTCVKPNQFKSAIELDQPIYTRKLYLGKSIYDSKIYGHFALFHPEKFPECLIIEVKWQQVKGTVDEKFPYMVCNINQKYPYITIIVLDGEGYRIGAAKWLNNQINEKLLHVFDITKFLKWMNDENL